MIRSLSFLRGANFSQTARFNNSLTNNLFYAFCSAGSNKAYRFGVSKEKWGKLMAVGDWKWSSRNAHFKANIEGYS